MKVLLTGSAGQVGRAMCAGAPPGVLLRACDVDELDITDPAAVTASVAADPPDWIVNAAAYTAVDRAEGDRAVALLLNATAVGHLAAAASAVGARLLHISTDFVFDGQASTPYVPEATTAPLGVYGETKLAGERKASAGNPQSLIVRTSWVYTTRGANFVHTMLRLMASRPEVRVVCDQVGSPTSATSLAATLWRLIERAAPAGTWHHSDAGVASWYDFAVAIQEEALARGLLREAVPVLPIRSADFPTAARRPSYSVLDCGATRAFTGLPPVHWRVQLRKVMDELATL